MGKEIQKLRADSSKAFCFDGKNVDTILSCGFSFYYSSLEGLVGK